ncbi:MAG: ABC transporter substrate-binding protein [Candidatus Fibromonas sp.]|nr:ABC transporter substrate-binding protein [Candidatus Fibromonas sp.]
MSGCTKKAEQQEYITIGALLPLTGQDSDEGLRALNGLQLAKEEINKSGGVLGKKLDIIVLNDKGDEKYVVQQYNALKERGVVAIIGSSYSGVTMALAQAAEKDGMPIISPTASNPDVTKGRPNVFRAIFIDDYQAEVMAYFAYNSLNARTAVILKNAVENSYGQISEPFAKSFIASGGQITAVELYSPGDDFAAILSKYAANPPDIFYCPEHFIPAANLVNAAYKTGLRNTNILGSDAWDGFLTYVYQSEAMKNVYYPAPFSFDDQDEIVTRFVRNYFSFFSQMPLTGSATTYTSVYILAEAIKKAGNTERENIVSAIKLNELDMITGHIKFDENNNPRPNLHILQIKDGIYTTYEKINL